MNTDLQFGTIEQMERAILTKGKALFAVVGQGNELVVKMRTDKCNIKAFDLGTRVSGRCSPVSPNIPYIKDLKRMLKPGRNVWHPTQVEHRVREAVSHHANSPERHKNGRPMRIRFLI